MEELEQVIRMILAAGWRLCNHCILGCKYTYVHTILLVNQNNKMNKKRVIMLPHLVELSLTMSTLPSS